MYTAPLLKREGVNIRHREMQTQQTSIPVGFRSHDMHLRPRFGTLVPSEIGRLILVSPALSWHPVSSVVLIPSTTVFRLAQGLAPLLESLHHGDDHRICFGHCFSCVQHRYSALHFEGAQYFFEWIGGWSDQLNQLHLIICNKCLN